MKINKFLPLAVIILILPVLFGCPSKNEPTPSGTDQQLTKLSKTWVATSAKLDNVDQTGYSAFTLKLSGTAGQTTFDYATTGRPPLSPWAAAGKFTFETDFATALKRDDGLPVTYSVTETPTPTLQLTFNYAGAGIAGRVSNVKGNWVFTFKPQ
jgi:hypothetical protein